MLYSLHGHIRWPCLHDPSPPVTSETRCPVSHPSPHCFQLPHNGLGWWSNASPFSHHNQPEQYTGKGPVRQWDSVFIQCPSPYAVHLRVGNLYIKTFFPCDIYLYFHNFPQNIKNRSQADVKSDIAPPRKLLLHSRESAVIQPLLPAQECKGTPVQGDECSHCWARKQSAQGSPVLSATLCFWIQRQQHHLQKNQWIGSGPPRQLLLLASGTHWKLETPKKTC